MIENITLAELEKQGKILFLRGQGISKKDIIDTGKYKCIHYGEIYTLYNTIINDTISRTDYLGNVLSKKGDVLFPATTTADAMGIAVARSLNEDGVIIGGDINICRTGNKFVLGDYLAYCICNQKQKKQLASYAKGINILHISNKDIKNIGIPLPPLETQKAIVAKLDQIFAELDQTKSEIQKNLDNTDELWKSALNQAFQGDWEVKKLGEIIKLVSGQDLTTKEYNSLGNGIPYITGASNIENESIIINRWTEFPKSIAKEGDLLITVKGTVGTMAILHEPKVHIARQIMAIENEKETTILYVKLFLETYIQKLKNSANGLIPGISRDTILNIQIPFPPLSEQEKIVEHLDQVSQEVKQLKSEYQSQLDNLEELKKSVLDKAFKGELVE